MIIRVVMTDDDRQWMKTSLRSVEMRVIASLGLSEVRMNRRNGVLIKIRRMISALLYLSSANNLANQTL